MDTAPPPTPKLLLTVEEAADALGIGRTTTFALIRQGALASVRIGRLRRVRTADLATYTASLTPAA
ncbi:helix-turn-helix domain-containing protein [Pseudofrankia sp. BMG5.36]|uniref:helix-turn-helix domain-containing protein n=1 Tax=Pseudofrankia sp. BMG5.36 TaxID=1834512 RepID=UPI0008DA9609|nr:helix-turn-helix domain-containing protein [Pseudofrankia sp. BMG5.36]OHV44899.1 helix-turn-helix domain-containing protein [Pseudofrankia sp. BMG5.36]